MHRISKNYTNRWLVWQIFISFDQRYNDKGLNVLGVYVGSNTDTARKEIVAKGMEDWTHIFMDEPVFYKVAPPVVKIIHQ